jgi:hypothetical protein
MGMPLIWKKYVTTATSAPACIMEIKTANNAVLLKDCSKWLFFLSINAPMIEKIKCVKARSTITIGNPAIKKPIVDTDATNAATIGEINMAIITGTWLANVNEAGSNLIPGNVIGISIPNAHNSADIVIIFTLFLF